MNIIPEYLPVGRLFGDDRTFRVPKYQRNYAWQTDEIGDFKADLKRCLEAREASQMRLHFFGGVVTVRQTVPGRQELEVVDGQQRLATFVLLISQLRFAMIKIAESIPSDAPEYENSTFLLDKVELLKSRFQLLKASVNMKVIDIPRLQLSGPDNEFFTRLIAGENPEIKRKSHEYLKSSFDQLGHFLEELTFDLVATDKAKRLNNMALVVEEDWTILKMETPSRDEAYTLFQVLNDRGRGLTEGELLRAKTLELLDGPGTSIQSTIVENAWDEILTQAADAVERNLRWIYSSYSGKRPSQAQLFDDLLSQFFPSSIKTTQSTADAASVVAAVNQIRNDYAISTRLLDGEWPYEDGSSNAIAWDKSRLRILTVELDHTNCMPLLIAAAHLEQSQFSEIVQLLERFVFRYKLVVNAHIGPASSAYYKQALEIRKDPSKYKVQSLKKALRALIEKHADDGKFGQLFAALQYGTSPSKKIKYALLTLEHYRAWIVKGANGKPMPDKMHVYDFPNTTVEHVYSLKDQTTNEEMAGAVNNIGNLAILGPNENNSAANKEFLAKKKYYENSCFSLTKAISELASWDRAAIDKRGMELKNMALRVFSF